MPSSMSTNVTLMPHAVLPGKELLGEPEAYKTLINTMRIAFYNLWRQQESVTRLHNSPYPILQCCCLALQPKLLCFLLWCSVLEALCSITVKKPFHDCTTKYSAEYILYKLSWQMATGSRISLPQGAHIDIPFFMGS